MPKKDANGALHSDKDGKFVSKGNGAEVKATLDRISNIGGKRTGLPEDVNEEKNSKDETEFSTDKITKQEWAMWYHSIGEIKRGMWCPKSKEGYLIEVGNKIFVTTGTYTKPKAKKVIFFKSDFTLQQYLSKYSRSDNE